MGGGLKAGFCLSHFDDRRTLWGKLNTESQAEAPLSPQWVELVERVLNEEATLEDTHQLNDALPRSSALLRHFVEMRLLHGALEEEFGGQSDRMDAISERVVALSGEPLPTAFPGSIRRTRALPSRRLAMVAALGLIVSLTAFWGVAKALHRPAFEVVARFETQSSKRIEPGQWIKTRQSIRLEKGAVELRSADGNRFTFQGPGELEVHDAHELTLHSGKLWADLSGAPIKVHAPRGEITDLGTVFGVEALTADTTRVDVFEGKVRYGLAQRNDVAEVADAGESLTTAGRVWNPTRGEAELSRYHPGLTRPLGFTFVADHAQAERIRNELAYGARWSTAVTPSGTMRLENSPVEVAWVGSNLFSAGGSGSAAAEVFHTHILCGSWSQQGDENHQERVAQAKILGLPHEDVGIVIQLRHLDAWLESTGARGYRIMVQRNSQVDGVRFLPIRAVRADTGGLLATLDHQSSDYRPADYPDGQGGVGARTLQRFDRVFTESSLQLTVESVEHEQESVNRGNISGLILEPVF